MKIVKRMRNGQQRQLTSTGKPQISYDIETRELHITRSSINSLHVNFTVKLSLQEFLNAATFAIGCVEERKQNRRGTK